MTHRSNRRDLLLDSASCLALVLLALALFSGFFLHVPVLTEVRDFLIYQGWGAKLSHVPIPTGSDYRPLSWVFFAWQHRLFPFNAQAVNLVQFTLLGLGAVFIYVHVRQLLGKRLFALGASLLWLLSLPAMDAAFWQATQHDKLALIFVLLTLIVSLHAIRLDSPKLILPFSGLILMLTVVAMATKPVAFMLPGALIAQLVLFTPEKTRSGYLRAAALVLIPIAYALVYVAGYLLKMTEEWRAHATSGDVTTNVLVYIRSVTNVDFNESLWLALPLFALVGLSWAHALWRYGKGIFTPPPANKTDSSVQEKHEAVLVYLCAIFIGCIAVLARARYPTAFYVLLPMFTFTASLATMASTFTVHRSATVRRSAATLIFVVVAGLLANCWTSVNASSRLGQWRSAAANLAQGYELLRNTVDPEAVESVEFFFPHKPLAYFYFFSDGAHTDIDPSIPTFIFRQTMNAPIKDRSGETPPLTASPGELIAIWSNGLELAEIRFGEEPAE